MSPTPLLPVQPLRSAATLLALFVLASGLGAAQDAPRARFGEEVRVGEVLVDVLVTDADDNVVIGLGADDFEVESDGVALAVTAASFYSNRAFLGPLDGEVPPELAGSAAAPAGERLFVLLVQRPALDADAGAVARLQQRLPEVGRLTFGWLVEDLLPGDRVAVLAWDGELVLLQDFSRDRRAAGEALERACSGRVEAGRWPSRYASEEAPSPLAAAVGSGLSASPGASLLEVLPALADSLGGLPGRKNLILLGDELPRPGGPDDEGTFARAEEALNEANVAVYALGLTGRGRQAGADHLAAVTGGESFYRADSVLDPLRRVARQTSGYYLLGVALPAGGPSGYRSLTVRARDPQLRVRARTGFIAGG